MPSIATRKLTMLLILDFLSFLCYNRVIILRSVMYMNSKNGNSVAGAIVTIAIVSFISIIGFASVNSNSNANSSKTTSSNNPSVVTPTPKTQPKIAVPEPETWTCEDATSYDRNPNNDNLCISNKGKRRYVSDCEAVGLDPNYHPSQRGASYYNGCA